MLKNSEYNNRVVNKRTKALLYIIFILNLIIIFRLFYLQFFEHDQYKKSAYSNVIKDIKIPPKRGNIYDREGNLIAGNRALYELTVIPEKIDGYRKNKKESVTKLFNSLEGVIDFSKINKNNIIKKVLNSASFKEVVILSDLTSEELSALTFNVKYIDGLNINARYVRSYPQKDLFLSLLGYVGRVSEKDLEEYKDIEILSSDFIGKIGLEKHYNEKLYGKVGNDKIVINSYGKIVDRKQNMLAKDGEDLHLSVDLELQKIAYDELTKINKKGAVVAMDVETGEILTFFSNPTYDANKFINKISQREYNKIFKKDSPLFNRVIQGQYPPASTVKPFMGLAALDGEFIYADEIVNCGGYYMIGKQKFRDWKRWGHGKINMEQSIAVSSDVYFYKLAHKMGIDYIHDYLTNFGYGKKVDIPFENQKSGILPSNEWKKKRYKEPFYAGDTVIVAIGQGAFLATPIQMLNSVSIIANHGEVVKMQFEKNIKREVLSKVNLNKKHLKTVQSGMYEVMHGEKGTGRAWGKKLSYKMAGKTGTAQVFSTKGEIDYDNKETPEHLKDHGLFISYAPLDKPKIAVFVIVEHGEGASSAIPISTKITNRYLEKQGKIEEEVKKDV
jgi:penicillin-binding protein 2